MVAYVEADPEEVILRGVHRRHTNIRALERTPASTGLGTIGASQFSPDGSQIVYQGGPFGESSTEVGDLFLATSRPSIRRA